MAEMVVIMKMRMPRRCVECKFARKDGDIYKCCATHEICSEPFEERSFDCPLASVNMNQNGPTKCNEKAEEMSKEYAQGYKDGWYAQRNSICKQLYEKSKNKMSILDNSCDAFENYKTVFKPRENARKHAER